MDQSRTKRSSHGSLTAHAKGEFSIGDCEMTLWRARHSRPRKTTLLNILDRIICWVDPTKLLNHSSATTPALLARQAQ
jgi:hypothetical protein